MPQALLTLDPLVAKGPQLLASAAEFDAAYASGQMGEARPSWAVAGTLWIDNSVSGQLIYKIYDGAQDATIARIDTATGAVTWLDLASQAEAEAAADNLKYMTPLRVRQATAALPAAVVDALSITAPDGSGVLPDTVNTLGALRDAVDALSLGGAVELIGEIEISSDAAISIVLPVADYDDFEIVFSNVKISGGDRNSLIMQTSSDGGTNFDAGASDYSWGLGEALYYSTTANSSTGDEEASSVVLARNIQYDTTNRANSNFSGVVRLFGPGSTSETTYISDVVLDYYFYTHPASYRALAHGRRLEAEVVNAVRFTLSSDSFASGVVKIYGIK